MEKWKSKLASTFLLLPLVLLSQAAPPAAVNTYISYSDAKAIVDALRSELLPAALRAATPADREAIWPEWVALRDDLIRSRVEKGDEDSIIHFLLFGTTFTNRPRATDRDLAALVRQPADALRLLQPRIDDFAVSVASPGTNERLQFARRIIERSGIRLTTEADRSQLRRYLDERVVSVGGAVQSSKLLDPDVEMIDKLTLFRDRGLSSDTSIFVDFGIEQALEAVKTKGVLQPGSVRRVAIVGPGLDFTDKQGGYDFYPQQTVQPFAIIDSLIRLGLATSAGLDVTAFDLSPRVIQHLESARQHARAGRSYGLVLPRNADRPWAPGLVKYWERFGDRIGEPVKAAPPPASAGRVEVRSVMVRPSIVLSIKPQNLNIVLQRLEPVSGADQFDLVVATNVLLYYDVFEQSLALQNVARMLRPGGMLLSNNRVVELPTAPIASIGYTDAVYMTLTGIGETGDRIVWYQRPRE